jgi:hypothetical protein
MPMQMPLTVPLFIVDQNFTSTLILVNITGLATYADVILSGLDGTEITRQRVQFTPHSQQAVDVYTLLLSAVSPATTGSIMVIQDPDLGGMAIATQLSLTYNGSLEPNYIDEEAMMLNPEGSQVLRAVTDPTEGSPVIAITSASKTAQKILIQCFDASGKAFSRASSLLPQQTLLTQACTSRIPSGDDPHATLANGEQNEDARPAAISLQTDGAPGSFAAFGLTPHGTSGRRHFSGIAFVDPKTVHSSSSVFTGVPVGSSPLLPDAIFTPELSFANFSAKAAHVTVKYAQTTDGTAAAKEVAEIAIPPNQTKSFALDNLSGNPDLTTSFLVTSDAAPGDVISKLVSKSGSELAEVELLAKDENDQPNGGVHPWSIRNDTESTLLLFNHSPSAVDFTVMISSLGQTWQKIYKLRSMETLSINLRNLIQTQLKDGSGKALPKLSVSGSVSWFTTGPGIGAGRLLLSSRDSAMARSFSCFYYSVLCPNTSAIVSPSNTPVATGMTDVFVASITAQYCTSSGGQPFCSGPWAGDSTSGYTTYWSSSNESVATIAGDNQSTTGVSANGVGVGQTTLSTTLSGQYGCTQPAGVQVSVVAPSATISQRTSGNVSSDDAAGPNYQSTEGTLNLGAIIGSGTSQGCFIGNEGIATITPSNYTANVIVHQQIVQDATFTNSTSTGGVTNQDDTAVAALRDDNPQSGGSNGKVYELDAPGAQPPNVDGNTYRLRAHLYLYATTADGHEISNQEYDYYVAVSCTKTASGYQFVNDVANDNRITTTPINLTWNLQ